VLPDQSLGTWCTVYLIRCDLAPQSSYYRCPDVDIDADAPGPVNIRIYIRSVTTIEEGMTVTALGRDLTTTNYLSFSGKVLEIDD